MVADDALSHPQRAERGDYVGCIAGALSFTEYREGLEAAGFVNIEIATHPVANGVPLPPSSAPQSPDRAAGVPDDRIGRCVLRRADTPLPRPPRPSADRRHRHRGQTSIRLRLPELTRTALRPLPIERGFKLVRATSEGSTGSGPLNRSVDA